MAPNRFALARVSALSALASFRSGSGDGVRPSMPALLSASTATERRKGIKLCAAFDKNQAMQAWGLVDKLQMIMRQDPDEGVKREAAQALLKVTEVMGM